MAIDHELRGTLIGASEVSQILGLSPWGDAFDVYIRKIDPQPESKPKPWLKRGRYFERGIVEWYGDETGVRTEWSDTTIRHASRDFQGCTPDAFVLDEVGLHVGGCDAKSVNWTHRDEFGESGTDLVPVYYAVQNHWTMSTIDKPWWDIAAAMSLDELRIYRIHRDADIESVLLEEVEHFWKRNILERIPPPIGATQSATDYLKRRFPRNVEVLRTATADEHELLVKLKNVGERWDAVNKECTAVENAVKLAIADSEGLIDGEAKVTWKKDRDSTGTDYEAVAKSLHTEAIRLGSQIELSDLMKDHQIVTRVGPRKLLTNWNACKQVRRK